MTLPTIHLTNWSSRKLHGPGRLWTIMARPRHWERGVGRVQPLTPDVGWLDALRGGKCTTERYFREFVDQCNLLGEGVLEPTALMGTTWDGPLAGVQDGDTLCCGCARGKPCHRLYAAPFLALAGWRVVLDGEDYNTDGATA